MKDLLIIAIIWLRGFRMGTKTDNLKINSSKFKKRQSYASVIDPLEARKFIGFHVVSMGIKNGEITNIVWGQ